MIFINIDVGQRGRTIVTLGLFAQPGEEGFAVKRFSKISGEGWRDHRRNKVTSRAMKKRRKTRVSKAFGGRLVERRG